MLPASAESRPIFSAERPIVLALPWELSWGLSWELPGELVADISAFFLTQNGLAFGLARQRRASR